MKRGERDGRSDYSKSTRVPDYIATGCRLYPADNSRRQRLQENLLLVGSLGILGQDIWPIWS